MIKTAWAVDPVLVGAGLYVPVLPGMCNADGVNAAGLAAAPSEERLQAIVRYGSIVVPTKCYFARNELGSSSWRRHGSTCVLVMDVAGNQLLAGNSVQLNAKALHEWGGESRSMDQFGGRDMAAVGGYPWRQVPGPPRLTGW